MVNGQVYSLEGQKKRINIIKTQDQRYNWKYKGNLKRTMQEIDEWVDNFNNTNEN